MVRLFSIIFAAVLISCLVMFAPPAMIVQQPPASVADQMAGTPPTAVWNQTYGGTEIDHVLEAIQTTDGGFVFVGSTVSYSPSDDRYSGWLVRTNATGHEQWNRSYPVGEASHFTGVVQNQAGGFTLAGWTYPQPYRGEGWLVKTNSTGHQQWNRSFGGAGSDFVYAMTATDDGGYVVAGKSRSFTDETAAWLVRFNATGHEMWNRTYAYGSYADAQAVVQTPDGGYAFVGSAGLARGWLVKVNATGHEQWNRTYHGDLQAVIHSRDGGYALAGTTTGVNGSSDAWVVKTNETGHSQWEYTVGGGEHDEATSIVRTTNGGFAIAVDLTPDENLTGTVGVVTLNATGHEQWRWTGSAPLGGESASITRTQTGEYLLAGTYHAPSVTDAWLIQLGQPTSTAALTNRMTLTEDTGNGHYRR